VAHGPGARNSWSEVLCYGVNACIWLFLSSRISPKRTLFWKVFLFPSLVKSLSKSTDNVDNFCTVHDDEVIAAFPKVLHFLISYIFGVM
jgi:hypothetical protein